MPTTIIGIERVLVMIDRNESFQFCLLSSGGQLPTRKGKQVQATKFIHEIGGKSKSEAGNNNSKKEVRKYAESPSSHKKLLKVNKTVST